MRGEEGRGDTSHIYFPQKIIKIGSRTLYGCVCAGIKPLIKAFRGSLCGYHE